FTLSSPAYLFAAETGNAALAPTVKLFDSSCTGTQITCRRTTSTNSLVGFQSSAVAAGTYVVVADSQAGNGGNYALVVSRSSTLGDTCADARKLTMTGTHVSVA